jgi:diaminohydroxyphosphoribosylaminopyrimidine deaminase/5-amino-6-(5-phosphoribosylamino)uracil reductase
VDEIGQNGVSSPIDAGHIPGGFRKTREMRFGEDSYAEWIRTF